MPQVANAKGDIGILKKAFNKNVALGERAVASDFEMVFKGAENLTALIRTTQTPELGRGDPVEDFGQYGQGFQQYGAIKRDGDIVANIVELKDGSTVDTLKRIVDEKEYIDIDLYLVGEGQERKGWRLETCLIRCDPADLDTSNRTGAVQIPVNIHHNWCERI